MKKFCKKGDSKKGDDFNPTVVDELMMKLGIVQTNWSERIDNCFTEDADVNALCQLALKSNRLHEDGST